MNTPKTDTLARLAEADLAYKNAKLTIRQRIREEEERKLEHLRIARSVLAYQAKEEGYFVTVIARDGLHTKATVTAYEAIAEGEQYTVKRGEFTGAVQEIQSGPAGTVRVTPPQGVIVPLLRLLNIDEQTFAETPELQYADFEVDQMSETISPVTEAYSERFGRHPVVALVMAEDPTYRQRIWEWAA